MFHLKNQFFMEKKEYLAPVVRVRPIITDGALLYEGSYPTDENEVIGGNGPLAKPYNPDENPFHFKSVWGE